MTNGEALRIQIGDPLVGVISGCLAVMETLEVWPDGSLIRARRMGRTSAGYRFPPLLRGSSHLQRMPKADAPLVHIVADWLDEHDEPVAAIKLRRAFPLG